MSSRARLRKGDVAGKRRREMGVGDWYRLAGALIRCLDAETAHGLAIRALRAGLVPASPAPADPVLAVPLWGKTFANPVGLAAGFDKNAEVADAMLRQGFGFVEVGTVTLRPQAGNPRPRLFRLPENRAVINRMGFNNDGLDAVAARLAARRRGAGCVVGANVGPNRDAPDPIADCIAGAARLAPLVDYLVVNVSSPNTPGLRALQDRDPLRRLLTALKDEGAPGAAGCPILVKIAPDLSPADLAAIADVARETGIDGIIATNTTIERPPDLSGRHCRETGGLSGPPLLARSTAVLADLYRLTEGTIPLIGVGGIASGADAWARIRAGATLVQLYTALVYEGPGLAARIAKDLAARCRAAGFMSVTEAVGADHREGGSTRLRTETTAG